MTTTASNPTNTSVSLHTLHGETMGTSWCVKLIASVRADLHALHAGVQARLDEVVAQMSTWEPDSDISRFNRSTAGTWQALPVELFSVITCAQETARASQGAFDPTIGALVAAWGFGATLHGHHVPDQGELATAQATVGWQRIALDLEKMSVFQPGGMMLDLSAIAKGYGVDLVALHLREKGIAAALIEVGGELFGYGRKPDGASWRVMAEAMPGMDSDDEEICVIELDGIAVATSGDHWHAFERDGKRYSHTIDPHTGKPVDKAAVAVTVIAASAMHADAWATALSVMGCEAGYRFAQEQNLAARFVMREDAGLVEFMTDAFRTRLAA
jgi:thiamine biosynthesis lipoprotein